MESSLRLDMGSRLDDCLYTLIKARVSVARRKMNTMQDSVIQTLIFLSYKAEPWVVKNLNKKCVNAHTLNRGHNVPQNL